MKKRNLKLVGQNEKKVVTSPKPKNFWNTCPRKLECLPKTPCSKGKESCNMKANCKVSCEWGINSEEHNYCFWTYVYDKSNDKGEMEPLLQNEIAKLFGCSATKIHFILKDAIEKLKNGGHLDILRDFLEEPPSRSTTEEYSVSEYPDHTIKE